MTAAYKIFPSIGIARLGNSATDFYFGPETYLGMPTEIVDGNEVPITNFRDKDNKIKRQAARFYIYKSDPNDPSKPGVPVSIGDDDILNIAWTVHIANKKFIWYQFDQLQGELGYEPTHALRNASLTDPEQRRQMMIDPGPQTVQGKNAHASFAKGQGQPGYPQTFPPDNLTPFSIDTLGEIRTDDQGRLLVLGGFGHSGSTDKEPVITTYANNDNWWDDIADGSVTATILLNNGEKITAASAWVIVAPPGYAPQIPNMVDLYDAMYDTAVRHFDYDNAIFNNSLWQTDYLPDFNTEIKPILQRPDTNRWVSPMPDFAHLFDYRTLGDPDPSNNPARQVIMDVLRTPDQVNVEKNSVDHMLMPLLAGDNPITEIIESKYVSLTFTQYFLLQQWVQGKFTNNAAEPSATQSGEDLSKAVLQNCVGAAFCPGIELTWTCRNPQLYTEPFRIKHKPLNGQGLSLGEDLNQGVEPGDLSKRMALPWQADFFECSSQTINNRSVAWWPAQRPLQVQLENFEQVSWTRGMPNNDTAAANRGDGDRPGDLAMVTEWKNLGFIKNVGPAGEPRYIEVERNPLYGNDD